MKVLILTNILTPYRMFLFAEFETQLLAAGGLLKVVAMAETESDRVWRYRDLQTHFTTLLPHMTFTLAGSNVHMTRGLRKVIADFGPDVVICAGSYTEPTVWQTLMMRWAPRSRFKVLFWSESHLHELTGRRLPARLVREFLRHITYRGFDGFLYPGQLSQELISKYARPDAQMLMFPNTVDSTLYDRARVRLQRQRIDLRRKYGIDVEKFVFITPARLARVKGLDRMLDLAKDMRRVRDVTFLVCGSGELEPHLREQARAHHIDLHLLGQRTIHEMAELYAVADCFLLPSISDPSPLSVVEALWSGLPLIVSSHVGNHPEAVRNGVNGYVFHYEEPENAARLLDLMVESDGPWRANASASSLTIARESFDTPKVVRELVRWLAQS